MTILEIAQNNNNNDDTFFDLETLITEGTESRVPIEIEFPDGRKAQALIRPITTGEFQTIYNGDAKELMVNVLSSALMNKEGKYLERGLIEKMPVGLPAKIVQQVFEISGIEVNIDDAENMKDVLSSFLGNRDR